MTTTLSLEPGSVTSVGAPATATIPPWKPREVPLDETRILILDVD